MPAGKRIRRESQCNFTTAQPASEAEIITHPIKAVITAKRIPMNDPVNNSSLLNTKTKGITKPELASFIASFPVSHTFASAIPAAANVERATGGVIVDSAPK
ncbi:hypothetical protein SDC9_177976 [bioreactor metagenome]|uniref:Uncharacterized protein n=1 Tax=bioreactor metagenome TaxID=1076179 RepID=A0A645GUP9_9ZZZZ